MTLSRAPAVMTREVCHSQVVINDYFNAVCDEGENLYDDDFEEPISEHISEESIAEDMHSFDDAGSEHGEHTPHTPVRLLLVALTNGADDQTSFNDCHK